ncbi:MAG: phosphate ABC transporter ATP-binding protein [Chloroflexaceae bacterium]|nr:phosphate ABC transporter ATP-binding protein [Chloroflexaceae bacterium]
MATITLHNFNVWYGQQHALRNIQLTLPAHQITAIIGPSGCGKSTLLKSMNRLLDLQPHVRTSRRLLLDDEDIYAPGVDVAAVRTRIGMLAQKPFPLPLSIYDNVAYGPRIHALHPTHQLDSVVQAHLTDVRLWDEVKDRLHSPAHRLSGGQQQRLCLARALSAQPEVLLCDESTASLDPISARGIEDLLASLRSAYTLVMVTHDLDQARRIADYVVFLWLGEVIEHGPAAAFFPAPQHSLSRDYLARKIG